MYARRGARMKEEIADKLMEKALTYLSSAEAFVGENVPNFIEELLSFKIFEHLLNASDIIVPIIISIVLFRIYKRDRELYRKDNDDFDDYWDTPRVGSISIILFVATLFTGLIILGDSKDQLIQAYKAYKAPRVYLVDYFKGQK